MKEKRINIWIMIITGITLVLGAVACDAVGLAATDTPEPTDEIPIVVSEGGVVSEGNLEPEEFRYLGFAVPGEVAEILVVKGDRVEAGEVLARLDGGEESQAAISTAELELEQAQQALDELERLSDLTLIEARTNLIAARQALVEAERAWEGIDTDEFAEELENAEVDVAETQEALQDAEQDYKPYADLPEDNQERQDKQDELEEARDEYQRAVRARDDLVNQRDLAEANLDQAQASLDEAQHQLDLVQNGPDQSQVSLLEMRIAAAQAQISAAQAALDSLELTAPFDGVVYDANILLNELVPTGNWAFILVDDSQWYVRTNDLTELEVVQVEVGQAVTLLPDSLPDLELSGEVVDISQTFNAQGGDILYDVLVKIDSLDSRLRWGMTFEVNFTE